jgi:hypothetical protein
MVNGPTDALLMPLVAVMVMAPDLPSSAVAGVPVSTPVLLSNVAHFGMPETLKVTSPLP